MLRRTGTNCNRQHSIQGSSHDASRFMQQYELYVVRTELIFEENLPKETLLISVERSFSYYQDIASSNGTSPRSISEHALNFRICRPFGILPSPPLPSPPPRRFFFSVDLFVRRRGLMDIMSIVSRNPSVHCI